MGVVVSLVLGLDVSTTATKAVLQDAEGIVRAVGTSAYPYETPHPLWSEQDPGLWWDATRIAVRAALEAADADAAAVQAVGLTGQMHGLVALDDRDEVLRPAILWNDQRTAAECDAIREIVGRERLIAITGNDALPGFTAPKLLWLRRHEPEVWAAIAHVLLPKDFVRLRLTGEHAVDRADGSGTMLFDLAARDWSPEILDALGIEPGWLPPTFEGPTVTGTITEAAASATGLRAGTPVIAGGGDQAAAAVGVGSVVPGVSSLSLGTSGVLFTTTEGPAIEPRGPTPRLLPRPPRPMAPHGRDALGGRAACVGTGMRSPPASRSRSSWRRRPRSPPGAMASCSFPTSPGSAPRTPIPSPGARSSV